MAKRKLTWKQQITQLAAELKVRSGRVQFLDPYDIPEHHRKRRSAFDCGFELGWRGQSYSNPYTSDVHVNAFAHGYRLGEEAASERIMDLLKTGK